MGRYAKAVFAAAIIIAVAAGGCKGKEQKNVFYHIGKGTITREDVDRVWKSLPEDMQREYLDRKGRQELLDNMIALELMYQEALKQKLDQDPDIKFKLERERKNTLAQQVVEKSMKMEDLYTYYQDNFAKIDAILFPVADDANAGEKAAAKASADAAFSQLQAGADFKEVKAKFDPKSRGELGYLSRDDLISNYSTDAATEVFAIKKGAKRNYTAPVSAEKGWAIFIVLEYPENLDPKGYDMVWEEIVNTKREEVFRGMINDLRTQIGVKPNQDNINGFLKLGDEYEKRQANPPQPGVPPAPMPGATGAQVNPAPGATAPEGPVVLPGTTAKPAPEKGGPQPGATAKPAPEKGAPKAQESQPKPETAKPGGKATK